MREKGIATTPRKRVKRNCLLCEKEFEIIPSWTKGKGGKFCSKKCANDHKRLIKGPNHPLDRKITKTCAWCGKEYRTKRAYEKKTRFCSRQCQGSYSAHKSERKQTSIELKVKRILYRIGIDFIQEAPIGPWVCDFLIPSSRIIIEADGDYWHSIEKVRKRDNSKTAWLEKHNYTVIRLPEHRINSNLKSCEQQIRQAIQPHQQPNIDTPDEMVETPIQYVLFPLEL